MPTRGRLLVLWNQIEEDVYAKWRAEGPRECLSARHLKGEGVDTPASSAMQVNDIIRAINRLFGQNSGDPFGVRTGRIPRKHSIQVERIKG